MLTRCTACGTAFRVTPEQLKVRLGRVRCGQCQTVFNALDSLIEEAPTGVPPVDLMPNEPSSPADIDDNVTYGAADADPLPEDSPVALPADAPSAIESEGSADHLNDASAPSADPSPPEATEESGREADAADPIADSSVSNSASRRWTWAMGLVLTLVVLAAQAIVHFRVELAVLAPALKPALIALCDPLNCDVPLPAHADLLAIENSDLHPGDHKGRLQLVATLKNRAPFIQAYPRLELTINDVADRALIVRSLSPEEYLPVTYSSPAGFAANSDLPLNLELDVGDLPAAGYRLYIYYP